MHRVVEAGQLVRCGVLNHLRASRRGAQTTPNLLAGAGCFDWSRDRDAWQKRMELELEDGISRLIKMNRGT